MATKSRSSLASGDVLNTDNEGAAFGIYPSSGGAVRMQSGGYMDPGYEMEVIRRAPDSPLEAAATNLTPQRERDLAPRRKKESEEVAEAKPYTPSLRERHAQKLQQLLADKGVDKYQANRLAQSLIGGPQSNLPFGLGLADIAVGSPYQAEESGYMLGEAKQAAGEGEYGSAALKAGLGALSAIPFAKPGAAVAKSAGKSLAPKAAEMAEGYLQRAGFMPSVVEGAKPARVAAPASSLGFYSPAEEAALNFQRKAGPGQAFLNEMQKAGASKNELEHTGIAEYLRSNPNLTREEVQEFVSKNKPQVEAKVLGGDLLKHPKQDELRELGLQYDPILDDVTPLHHTIGVKRSGFGSEPHWSENLNQFDTDYANKLANEIRKSEPKYSNYQLPGGQNYREVLLTLPDAKDKHAGSYAKTPSGFWRVIFKNGDTAVVRSEQEAKELVGTPAYRSSHWDEPNVLAHIRLNDRVDNEGKKVLFVEELQSDWGQEHSKRERALAKATTEGGRAVAQSQLDKTSKAPFVTKTNDWVDLGLKHIMKHAADKGYDRVAFINGPQSADRYDLSKYLSSVTATPNKDGSFALATVDRNGRRETSIAVPPGKLDEYVGKEMADRITKAGGGTFEGENLRVPHKGMEDFYDKLVPAQAQALLKKFGGEKMQEVVFPGAGELKPFVPTVQPGEREYLISLMRQEAQQKLMDQGVDAATAKETAYSLRHGVIASMTGRKAELEDLTARLLADDSARREFERASKQGSVGTQLGFDITPEMRERLKKPIAYAEGGAVGLETTPDMSDGGQIIPVKETGMKKGGFVGDADKIAESLTKGGMDKDKALTHAVRMAKVKQDAPKVKPKSVPEGAEEFKNAVIQKFQVGGVVSGLIGSGAKTAIAAKKGAAFTEKVLASQAEKIAEKIAQANPKLTEQEIAKKALTQADKKLTWERQDKPQLEKTYGQLEKSKYSDPLQKRQKNVEAVVQERIKKAKDFLAQPTEPWQPPPGELQAFDRERIKDALEGFPGVEQTKFPRYEPARADLSHVEEVYGDPVNRGLIKQQIERGLPLGGETFYGSLYPLKLAVLERGIPEEKFNQFVYSIAPASARNSILNEVAVGQFLRDMKARGLPLDEQTVKQEMAAFKQKYGTGLPLMPIHREGVRQVIEGPINLREHVKADIPTNYKIPTYGTQKAGDFGKSVVLDVHEAAGETQGSKYHPYFTEQGGFGPTEYGLAENKMLDIAGEMGIPGGMAQAGRWFGGGELTGLKSPRGDALDLLEKQAAYTLQGQGINPTPKTVRNYILNMIDTGEGVMMPWFKNAPLPDVRTVKKEGGLAQATRK